MVILESKNYQYLLGKSASVIRDKLIAPLIPDASDGMGTWASFAYRIAKGQVGKATLAVVDSLGDLCPSLVGLDIKRLVQLTRERSDLVHYPVEFADDVIKLTSQLKAFNFEDGDTVAALAEDMQRILLENIEVVVESINKPKKYRKKMERRNYAINSNGSNMFYA